MTRAVSIRAAAATDQGAIDALVRGARLNPRGLAWPAFLVAEAGGAVVGCIQVRRLSRGTPEVASVVVAPAARGAGVGAALVEALIARHDETLFLVTDLRTVPFFERFGFEVFSPSDAPPDLARQRRLGTFVTTVRRLFGGPRVRLVVMRRWRTAQERSAHSRRL